MKPVSCRPFGHGARRSGRTVDARVESCRQRSPPPQVLLLPSGEPVAGATTGMDASLRRDERSKLRRSSRGRH